jgi:hypothetical protein
MDRTVGIYDLSALLDEGISSVPLVATKATIGTEKLSAQVLQGSDFSTTRATCASRATDT